MHYNKKSANKLSAVLINCMIIFFTAALPVWGQSNESDLKDKTVNIKMNQKPLGKVFEYLMNQYNIAIGFEESIFDRDHNDYDFVINLPLKEEEIFVLLKKNQDIVPTGEQYFGVSQRLITINAENERLENVLNIIIGQMKNYKWEINDDVVNVFPIQGRDERYEQLLKTKIENFDLKKEANFGSIRAYLFILPEFTMFLKDNNLRSTTKITDVLVSKYKKLPVEMNFSNLTFRDLLNKITKVKRGGWILKYRQANKPGEKEFIEINI